MSMHLHDFFGNEGINKDSTGKSLEANHNTTCFKPHNTVPGNPNELAGGKRPRVTLSPTLVEHQDGTPWLVLSTPGGDNQEQTIIQSFLATVEFWPDWYPNLHTAFEWPRVQTLHFIGSFWPHNSGFNKLSLEANIPDAVFQDLKPFSWNQAGRSGSLSRRSSHSKAVSGLPVKARVPAI